MNLYLLQDGTYADPADVSDKGGVLVHKNGLKVAVHEDGSPQTLERGAVDNKNVQAAKIGEKPVDAPVKPLSVSDKDKPSEKPVTPVAADRPSAHVPASAPATSAKPAEAPVKVNRV